MLRCFLILKNKLFHKGKINMINKTRLRAYTKTMADGIREIEKIPELYRIPVYIELIADYSWTLDMLDERYISMVKEELGLTEIVEA